MKKKVIIAHIVIIVLIIAFAVMTHIYLKTKYINERETTDLRSQISELNEQRSKLKRRQENIRMAQTFYATIKKKIEPINEYTTRMLLVEGLDINDRDFRGEWKIVIKDPRILRWQGKIIDISELDVGDKISITYADESIEDVNSPTLSDIILIELLDDDK